MQNQITLFASTTVLALTFNDVYLIIVGVSILVSTIIAIINAVKSGKQINIDKSTQDQLKDIDKQLNNKDKESSE